MTDLVERIVEAWEEIPEWANGSKAEAAIAIVVEEVAKVAEGHLPFGHPTQIATAIRAMKGRAND